MLVNKYPLNISIPQQVPINTSTMNDQEDIAMMDELTPVSTPTEQVMFNYNSFPEPPKCGRTASVSSIASSISNFSTTNHDLNLTSFANHYKLTESFENLLFDTYQKYQSNPTVTPFNELNPPSGVINKVTKEALRLALEKNVEIGIEINNYSLTIIRQKLIQLCKTYNQQNGTTSRANSVTSLNSFPSLNLQTRFTNTNPTIQQQIVQFDLRTPTDGYFNFESPVTPNPPYSINSIPNPSPFSPGLSSNLSSQPQLQHAPQLGQGVGLQPSFLQESGPSTPIGVSASPVNEFFVPDALFNATSNRKRESLRLKRSGNQASF